MRYKNLLSLFFLLLTVYQTFGRQAVLSSGSNATGNIGNSTPTLAAIANQATCDGQTISNIALTLGGDLDATLSANDNSQTINPTYTFGGSGADRTLTIATVAGQIGATTVTITATTSTGAMATRTFTLEVGKKQQNFTVGTATTFKSTENNLASFDFAPDGKLYIGVGNSTGGVSSNAIRQYDANANLLNANYITNTGSSLRLHSDSQGNLLFSTNSNSISKYNGQTLTNSKASVVPSVLKIVTDPSGNIYFINGQSVPNGGIYYLPSNFNSSTTASLIVNGYGNSISVSIAPDGSKLYLTDSNNNKVVRLNPDGTNATDFILVQNPLDILFDKTGQMYLYHNGKLSLVAPNGQLTEVISIGFNVGNINFDANGNLYYRVVSGSSARIEKRVITKETTYTSCNTAPVIAPVATQTTCDNITKTVNLSISDAESNPVTVTATSSNTTLVPNANISYNAGVLSIIPANNQVGIATITLTPNDGFINGTPVMFTLEVGKKVITQGTWIGRTAAEANSWQALTYANGLYVAVAATGTNRVMTSPDAINWTARTAAQANSWVSVTYGNGLFVAVAQDGTNRVMTSPDGINWTARTAAQANSWLSVTYGNGLFVAVAYNGTNQVMTSPDGINWTAREATEANNWDEVSYGNGVFMAVSLTGTNRVMHSTDGITWTPQMAAQYNGWQAVDFGNNQFVALTYEGTSRVMTNSPTTTYTSCNTAPVIAPVATQTTCDNITKTVNLSISDTESNPVTVTATSSNTTLVPNANISYNAGVLSIIPANNQVGIATITLTPNDGFVNGTPVMFNLEVGKKVVGTPIATDFATTVRPTFLAKNANGQLFASSFDDSKVVSITQAGVVSDYYNVGGFATGLDFNTNGNLYVNNFTAKRITQVTPALAGTAVGPTYSGNIQGLYSASDGMIYVSDFSSGIIRQFNPTANTSVDFVTGLSGPSSVILDNNNNMYISEAGTNKVLKRTPAGTISNYFTDVNLSGPRGLAFDSEGSLFVASVGNNKIFKIAPGGGSGIEYASTGLGSPIGLLIINDILYVASYANNKIVKYTPGLTTYTTCCTIPTITANTPASRCGSGSVTLSATPSAGSIQWFTTETGGTALVSGVDYTISGNNLTINNLTATTTFYAQAVDGSCISATRTAVIATFNALSVPNPSSDSPKCVGTTLTFNSVVGMTTYAWSGPNAFTASTQKPSITNVTAAAQGTYTLTVTNAGGCTASATTAVTINALPVPNPSSDSPKCVGTTLTFNSVVGMTTYAWSGPNAFTANIQNPSITNVTAAANGTYTLTVTNTDGCTASATTAVIINALPAAVNIQPVSPLCERETLYLTASLNDGNLFNTYTYSWAGPNAFSATTQSPTINNVSAAAQGTYTLTITNAGGCSASATTAVTVYSLPAIPTITADNMQICKGSSVILTGTCSTAEASFRWLAASFLGNQLPSSNTRVITEPGVYRGICESKEGCISDVVSISIELATNCSDKGFITILPEKPAICPGQSISMTASGCSGTLSWNDGTSTQTGTTVSFSPTVTTGYFVSCSTGSTTSFDIVVAKTNLAVASNVSTGKERFKAVETLSSDKKVGNANFTPGASVIYEAGKAIILEPGFVAEKWSIFKAEIKTCN